MNYDYSLKIATVGCTHVGKTAIVNRFCDDRFKSVWESTIGVDFSARTIKIGDKLIKFQIWDTAGQENFAPIIRSYYRGVSGIMMVFDVGVRSITNFVVSGVTVYQSYAGSNSVSTFISFFMLVSMKLYSAWGVGTLSIRDERANSAYLKEPKTYNTIDSDFKIEEQDPLVESKVDVNVREI